MIRRFIPSDLEEAAEAFCAAFTSAPWKEKWTVELAAARISELTSSPQSVGYVLVDNDVVKGILVGRVLTYLFGTEYVVDELCIAPDVQHKGGGTELLKYAEKDLAKDGVVAMALVTTSGYPTHKFCLKNGFAENKDVMFMFRPLDKI